MSIVLPPAQQMICNEFTDPNTGNDGKSKTVVITPLRITWVTEDSQKLSFGCSFWKFCLNEQCSFSKAGSDYKP